MFRTLLLLMMFSFILIASGRAENGSPDSGFTSTTTHIEADVWGYLKIDRPKAPDRPPKPKEAPKSHPEKLSATEMNFFGVVLGSRYYDERGRIRAWRDGLIEFPELSCHFRRRTVSRVPRNYAGGYLVALYDDAAEMDYDKQNDRGGNAKYSHVAVLDAPILFTGFKARFDAPGRSYWEALDLPLSTTISHLTDRDRETWKALNVPLIEGFRYDRNGQQASTSVLDVPLAEFYSSHRSPGHSHWELVDVPFFTLAEGRRDKESGSFTLLDGPLFYLWSSDYDKDGGSTRFLRVPLLGPLCSVSSGEDGSSFRVFPGIFSGSSED